MSENIKAVIKIHIIILFSLVLSSLGVWLLDENIARYYAGVTICIVPLSTVFFMFVTAKKEEKEGADDVE